MLRSGLDLSFSPPPFRDFYQELLLLQQSEGISSIPADTFLSFAGMKKIKLFSYQQLLSMLKTFNSLQRSFLFTE